MWSEARSFIEAADALSTRKHRTAQLHLVAHGIELALKSHLRAKGYTLNRLINLGHDPRRVAKECTRLGMQGPSEQVQAHLNFLSKAHESQEFRYAHTKGPRHMDRPDWIIVTDWAVRAAIPAVAECTAPNALAVHGHVKAMEGWATKTIAGG
jgi:hypothetical protein